MGSKNKILNSYKSKYHSSRPLDYIYDPDYVVSGYYDFQKCIVESSKTQAEFDICPLYATMFSDAYPRCMMVMKRLDRLPSWFDRSWKGHQRAVTRNTKKPLDVDGVDRYRFFRRPMASFLQPAITTILLNAVDTEEKREQSGESVPRIQNRGTQTDYRESETQTSPWAPPTFTRSASTPEVLTLANLSWSHGLPAGMHEVEIIERARIKRAWEEAMPTSADPKSIEKMRHIIDTMERDEWVFREKEIQTIHDMRLDLARQLLKKYQSEETSKLKVRLQRYLAVKQQEKNRKIQKIRLDHNRELRKLALRHKGINMKYHEMNVVEEHRDHNSELYGPQMRFGEHPKRRHEVINVRSRFLTHIKGLEILEMVPKLLQRSHLLTKSVVRKNYELCVRETRWTEAVLEKLHQDLKDIRMKTFGEPEHIGLISRLPKPIPVPETPGTEGVPDSEEEEYQGAVFLQKIIRGRATQTLMCKGRRKCQELIEEMKSTTALQQGDLLHIMQEREYELSLQREQLLNQREEAHMAEIMEFLEGHTVSFMLDFLSKELWRLQDERRAHAFALLAERERCKREAAEAGRRQKEERRRREHDEMFRQVVKVHQDTVDMYLEDLVLESTEWVADAESRHHVRRLAQKIDKAAEEFNLRQDDLQQEELVADLIHNFVVPEVQKQIIRKQIKQRQAKYLQEAHASIYNRIETLPPVDHLVKQPVSTGEETEKDQEPSTNDEEEEEEISTEEEQLQDTEEVVEDEFVSFKEPERGEEEEAFPVGILHEFDGVEETLETLAEFEDDSEEWEKLEDVPIMSEEIKDLVEEDQDQEAHEIGVDDGDKYETEYISEEDKPEVPSTEEEDEGFKKPDIEDESSKHLKSKPKIGFIETDTDDEDESTRHPKSKPKIGFIEPESGEDESTQHPKPKSKRNIGFKEPDIDDEGDSSQHTKPKHKIGFREPDIGDEGESSQQPKSRPKIGFREPEDDSDEETSRHSRGKPKLSFKD